ncbi:hypothetical protein BOTBODRAFT_175939 [Botryobasidium botryosum FD-172 SS1]|uniref:Uncharacterized protein n=1 Tax=Botryobasidium botryosum (strain FD-172 SS1) TaxID=930990 RepID=A0A067MMG6_BOTB1|nr:hypothetical protein BOTBODRAFT_175939 [Botryobasidium botryosum FD-172 SS1]
MNTNYSSLFNSGLLQMNKRSERPCASPWPAHQSPRRAPRRKSICRPPPLAWCLAPAAPAPAPPPQPSPQYKSFLSFDIADSSLSRNRSSSISSIATLKAWGAVSSKFNPEKRRSSLPEHSTQAPPRSIFARRRSLPDAKPIPRHSLPDVPRPPAPSPVQRLATLPPLETQHARRPSTPCTFISPSDALRLTIPSPIEFSLRRTPSLLSVSSTSSYSSYSTCSSASTTYKRSHRSDALAQLEGRYGQLPLSLQSSFVPFLGGDDEEEDGFSPLRVALSPVLNTWYGQNFMDLKDDEVWTTALDGFKFP